MTRPGIEPRSPRPLANTNHYTNVRRFIAQYYTELISTNKKYLTVSLTKSTFYALPVCLLWKIYIYHSRKFSSLKTLFYLKLKCWSGHVSFFLSSSPLISYSRHMHFSFAIRGKSFSFLLVCQKFCHILVTRAITQQLHMLRSWKWGIPVRWWFYLIFSKCYSQDLPP